MTVAIAAPTGSAAAWAIAGLALSLLAAYGGLLAWLTHQAGVREWDLRAHGPPDTLTDLLQLERIRVH